MGVLNCAACKRDFSSKTFRSTCSKRCDERKRRMIARGEHVPDLWGSNETRFWFYVNRVASGCWLWAGGVRGDGYGMFTVLDGRRGTGRQMASHRFAYETKHGPIESAEWSVCHKCDTPLCCNPDHLFLGTTADNMADASRKGRTPRGEKAGTAKLTTAQVQEIAALYASGEHRQVDLAKAFGVCQRTISLVVNGRTWIDIKRERKIPVESL